MTPNEREGRTVHFFGGDKDRIGMGPRAHAQATPDSRRHRQICKDGVQALRERVPWLGCVFLNRIRHHFDKNTRANPPIPSKEPPPLRLQRGCNEAERAKNGKSGS